MSARLLIDFYGLKRNLTQSPSVIKRTQTKKLREALRYAYWNVPFYHTKFKKSGIKPNDVKTIRDLSRIPVTTKREIQATPLNEMLAKNIDVNKCKKNSTSGSTGVPLTTLADERTLRLEGAMWLRAYVENGFRLVDKRVIITDPRIFPRKKKWLNDSG